MILKISINKSVDRELRNNVTIYAQVASIVIEATTEIVLTHCPFRLDRFQDFPVMATVRKPSQKASEFYLYCEWAERDEDDLNYVDFIVRVEQVEAFPFFA